MTEGSTVLVTGGAGFIGSHVVERLLNSGARVRVLDNLSTGKRENLPHDGKFEFIEGDIRDAGTVTRTMRGVTAVIHLAAVASVQASVDDPSGTHASNFDGTLNLLEAARSAGVSHFLYASSAAVYGDGAPLPVTEDTRLDPLTPYAADKLAGEHYLGFYCRQYGLNGTAFRFFNIYGPRQDPSSPYSGVISIFVNRLRAREAVTIFGDGRQTRDFVYVGDLAALLVKALARDDLRGVVMNVGRGVECSLLDLLAALEELSDCRMARDFLDRRAGDIQRSVADVTCLKRYFGTVPATAIKEGLGRLLTFRS
jgi:UDP-glucose 4-epimerase